MAKKFKYFIAALFAFGLLLPACSGGANHVHTFSNEWSADDTYHWHAATCEHQEEISDKAVHSFGSPVIDKPATEYETGTQHTTCSVCGHTVSTIIPKQEHTHKASAPVEENRVEATCTEDGSYDLVTYCSECHEEISREHKTISKLGHNFGAPTYVWSNDYSYCTATRVCQTDNTHVETEANSSTYIVVTEATLSAEGLAKYEVTFTNSAFETQTHEIVLPVVELLTYELNEDQQSYCVNKGPLGVSGDIVIPATYNDLPVTKIGRFNFCDELTSIVIPNSVTQIGSYAFQGCTSLTSITLPENLSRVEERAFKGCTSLTSFSFPESVNYIGEGALEECTSLTSVTIPFVGETADAEEKCFFAHIFGDYSYQNSYKVSKSLRTVTILEGCTRIGDYAFQGLSMLTTINLPNTVTAIGAWSFYSCTNLTSLTLPEGVTSIGEGAFSDCRAFISFTIPNTVTSIGASAFEGCSSLETITIPNTVTSIGASAFSNCSSLTSLAIPYGITSVSANLCSRCTSLKTVSIPETVTSIGDRAFEGCSSLETITIPDNVTSIGASAFEYCSPLTTVVIPDKVTFLGNYAFASCENLSSITIPSGVTKIEENTFKSDILLSDTYIKINSVEDFINMKGKEYLEGNNIHLIDENGDEITELVVPNTVTSIPNYTFLNCTSLTSITLPNTVTSIGDNAFENCDQLQTLSIPDSITYIGEDVFEDCDHLQYNIYNNAYYLGNNENKNALLIKAFNRNSTSCTIHENCVAIYNDAFRNCNLTSIVVPDSVKYIGRRVFTNCSSIASVTLPFIGDGTGEINYLSYLFGATSSDYKDTVVREVLETVTLSSKCTKITEDAFAMCYYIKTINVPDTISYIATDAFKDCSSLQYNISGNGKYLGNDSNDYTVFVKVNDENETTCEIEDGCKYICDNAFSSALTSIVVPEGVTSIGDNTFEGCTNLESLSLPTSLTSIDSHGFDDCIKLTFNEYDNAEYLGNSVNPYVVLVEAKNKSITSCDIHDDCKFIYRSAFSECTSLTSVTTNEILISIDNAAFYGCSKLQSLVVPHTVTNLGRYVFNGCSKLVGTTNGNAVYLGDETNPYLVLLKAEKAGITTCNVNEGCRFIHGEAFKDCKYLISVTIPETVTLIQESAFEGCSDLSKVNIPNSVTSIEASTFFNCISLTLLAIPESVTSIGRKAFAYSGLTSIVIPDSVTYIGEYAFENCTFLAKVTISKNITVIYQYTFASCTALETINFNGTRAEWQMIAKGKSWNYGVPANIIHCIDFNASIS